MKENQIEFANHLKIKDVIHKVQQELAESQNEREEKGLPPLFEVDSLDIEIHFVVQQHADSRVGASLAVIDVGADHNYSQEQIHKMTLRLKKFEGFGADFSPPAWEGGLLPNEEEYDV